MAYAWLTAVTVNIQMIGGNILKFIGQNSKSSGMISIPDVQTVLHGSNFCFRRTADVDKNSCVGPRAQGAISLDISCMFCMDASSEPVISILTAVIMLDIVQWVHRISDEAETVELGLRSFRQIHKHSCVAHL